MDMNQMMMARHHAEMYMLDMQAAQAFQTLGCISTAKAQSNYQMYQMMSGAGGMPQQFPGMTGPGMIPGMDTSIMTPGMMGDYGYEARTGMGTGSGASGGTTGTGSGGRDLDY